MKTTSTLVVLFSTALASAQSFYNETGDYTCSVNDAGTISCEEGHIDNAPMLEFEEFDLDGFPVDVGSGVVDGVEDKSLHKRVTCGATVGGFGACPLRCMTLGFCNSACDDQGICRCSCVTQGLLPCRVTSCS